MSSPCEMYEDRLISGALTTSDHDHAARCGPCKGLTSMLEKLHTDLSDPPSPIGDRPIWLTALRARRARRRRIWAFGGGALAAVAATLAIVVTLDSPATQPVKDGVVSSTDPALSAGSATAPHPDPVIRPDWMRGVEALGATCTFLEAPSATTPTPRQHLPVRCVAASSLTVSKDRIAAREEAIAVALDHMLGSLAEYTNPDWLADRTDLTATDLAWFDQWVVPAYREERDLLLAVVRTQPSGTPAYVSAYERLTDVWSRMRNALVTSSAAIDDVTRADDWHWEEYADGVVAWVRLDLTPAQMDALAQHYKVPPPRAWDNALIDAFPLLAYGYEDFHGGHLIAKVTTTAMFDFGQAQRPGQAERETRRALRKFAMGWREAAERP